MYVEISLTLTVRNTVVKVSGKVSVKVAKEKFSRKIQSVISPETFLHILR